MRNYRPILFILLLVTGLLFPVQGEAEENLLVNGDFEQTAPGRLPPGWSIDYYREGAVFQVTGEKVYSGRQALKIQSETENDVRLIQPVKVKPFTYYRLSGWIATEGVTENKVGANLCVVDHSFHHSPYITGTTGWTRVELNFRTYAGQNEVTIGARLGMWGNTVTGTVYFDDLRLEELTTAPEFYRQLEPEPAPETTQPVPEEAPGGRAARRWGWAALPALLIVAYIIYLENRKEK